MTRNMLIAVIVLAIGAAIYYFCFSKEAKIKGAMDRFGFNREQAEKYIDNQ